MIGVARTTASEAQFPMMNVKRNTGIGLTLPCSSQNIPQRATATPSSTNCICRKSKTGRGVSFGNGRKLFGMNALLFIIAPLPIAAQLEMGWRDYVRLVGHPLGP